MDVDDAGRERLQQGGFYQPHEAGQAHAVHAVFLQARGNGLLGFLREFGLEARTVDHFRRNAPGTGAFQNVGIRVVGHHHGYFRLEGAGPDGVMNGLAIGAGSGAEYS